jgi:hypothetical protein
MAVMSPRLKPLLLPQMVEERKKMEIGDLSYAYYTTNSSSSDVTSPVTPTFSAKGHYRGSSSTSSLDLPYAQVQDSPASPTQQITEKSTIRQLPDVKEEPFEREDEPRDPLDDQFELYSCLCKYENASLSTKRMTDCILKATHHVSIDLTMGDHFLWKGFRNTTWTMRWAA